MFEWSKEHYDHTIYGILVSQYLMNFFVNECRKNNQTFHTKQMELSSLIYNFNLLYTAKNGCQYEQCYVIS